MNKPPAKVSLSFAPADTLAYTRPEINLESEMVTLLPVRQIVPPLDVEFFSPKPTLLLHIIPLIKPKLPSQFNAPPSSSTMLSVKLE